MNKFEECINCQGTLQENETHLCFECDFTNKITIEFTIEIHNLDTEKFIKSIKDFGDRLNTSNCIRLSDLNTNGFNEINLNNITSIKISEVKKKMISNMAIINNKYETKIEYEKNRPYIEKPDKSKLFLDKLTVEKLELHEIHTIQLGIVTFENESKVNKN